MKYTKKKTEGRYHARRGDPTIFSSLPSFSVYEADNESNVDDDDHGADDGNHNDDQLGQLSSSAQHLVQKQLAVT